MRQPDVQRFSDPASLEWIDAAGHVHVFEFDLVLQEEWKNDATVTDYPVEIGANVSDHVRVEAPTCTLTIFATNEPLDDNQWQRANPATVQLLSFPTPTWTPASGIVGYTDYDNLIDERATGASLLGGLAGSATKALGGLSSAVAGVVGTALGFLIPGDVAENAVELQGEAVGVFAVNAASALIPGQKIPKVHQSDAGLKPPVPAPPAQSSVLTFANAQDFVEATISALLDLKDAAQPLILLGSKQVEADMVITSVAHTRQAEDGSGASITLALKQVRIVSTNVVAAPIPSLPGAASNANKGGQNPTDASAAQQGQSTSRALLHSDFGRNTIKKFTGFEIGS